MAIIGNTASEIGDVMIIHGETPVLGLVTLETFSANLEGETSERFFDVEFRYTVDGINFVTWRKLSDAQVQAVNVNPLTPFIVEYKLTRVGSDVTGLLVFNEIILMGTYIPTECSDLYKDSIFATFFECMDAEVIEWYVNVMGKAYKAGMIAKYIERGREQNVSAEDEDFLSLYGSVANFFAYIVVYARRFGLWHTNDLLLRLYLESRSMKLCSNTLSEDLIYIKSHLYDEIRQRGTKMVFVRKDVAGKPVDGEFLRTICYDYRDEFLVTDTPNEKIGWVLGEATPLDYSTHQDDNLIKGYSKEKDISSSNIADYPIVDEGGGSLYNSPMAIELVPSANFLTGGAPLSVMRVVAPTAGTRAGIGGISNEKAFYVDKRMTYEISAWVRTSHYDNVIHFGCYTYTDDVGEINKIYPRNVFTDNLSETFFKGTIRHIAQWVHLRGIIYGQQYVVPAGATAADYFPSIGAGYSLKMANIQCCPILLKPFIYLDNIAGASVGSIEVWDFKCRPAVRSYGTGMLGVPNLLQIWCRNNNGNLLNEVTPLAYEEHPINGNQVIGNRPLDDFTRENLIPYSSEMIINMLNQ